MRNAPSHGENPSRFPIDHPPLHSFSTLEKCQFSRIVKVERMVKIFLLQKGKVRLFRTNGLFRRENGTLALCGFLFFNRKERKEGAKYATHKVQ